MSKVTVVDQVTGTGGARPIVLPRLADDFSVSIPASASTLLGFRQWVASEAFPDRFHIAYLGGEIYVDMSPERIGIHNAAKSEINHVLYQLARELNLGRYLSDGTLVSNEAGEVSNEPDGVFVAWSTSASGRAKFVLTQSGDDGLEVEGTPDMILEVVSPSSEKKDYQILRERYHLAGIPEYWLIDGRADDIIFQILRFTPLGYEVSPGEDGWLRSAVFGRRFRLDRVRAPDGLWQYTLHVAPTTTA